MKIVHITSSVGGGAGIAAYRIHKSLMQHEDVKSSIVQRFQPTDSQIEDNVYQYNSISILNKINRRLGLSKIEQYKKKIGKQPRNYEIVSLPYSYFKVHKDRIVQEADIIHLHWVTNFIDYPSFLKNTKQPIVWTLHDMNPFLGIFHYQGDVDRNKSTTLKDIDCEMLKVKLRNIGGRNNIHIATPSQWMCEHSMRSEVFKGRPHSVIGNCLNPNEYSNQNDRIACKAELGIDSSRTTLLFVADNIHNYRKGMDLLLGALQYLPTNSYNLISVGQGNIEKYLPVDINYTSLGLINNPSLLNKVYSAADVTILPSREDNLPNVMFESMLNGTPVISFSNGGMAEHIITGQNGILVDEMTSAALAGAIKQFIDGEYKFDYSDIKQYPIDNLNYEKQTQLYIDLYKSLL